MKDPRHPWSMASSVGLAGDAATKAAGDAATKAEGAGGPGSAVPWEGGAFEWSLKCNILLYFFLLLKKHYKNLLGLRAVNKYIYKNIGACLNPQNKYWKYTQIFAAAKSSKFIKFWRLCKILASHENFGGYPKYWRLMKLLADTQNLGVSWKYWRVPKILASHGNFGRYTKNRRLAKI